MGKRIYFLHANQKKASMVMLVAGKSDITTRNIAKDKKVDYMMVMIMMKMVCS
jgi:hypothetical protein